MERILFPLAFGRWAKAKKEVAGCYLATSFLLVF